MSSTISNSTGSSATTTPAATSASSLITSTGIGSGLDIGAIVTALTNSFGAAQTNSLNSQETTLDAQVSAYGTFTSSVDKLKSTLGTLEVPSHLAGFKATVADDKIASATVNANAVAGTYSLQVQNLATAATLTSAPLSTTAAVGSGTLTVTVGGKSTAVTIDTSNNTLAGIAGAINSQSGASGVTASIIATTAGSRLVLAGTATGSANAISVAQSGGDGGLAALTYDPASTTNGLTQSQAAQDANFLINGFPATSTSNQVTSAISGVTLNLTAASAADTPTSVTVSPDTSAAHDAIHAFVDALNDTLSSIATLTSYDPTSQTAGPLNGNATLQSFQNQLQSLLGKLTTGNGSVGSLADLGISVGADGTYSVDDTKLGNALTGNLANVTSFLSGTTGLATQLDTFINGYTKTGGILDTINTGLNASLKSVASQQAALTAQLAAYSARLTAEYNAMDTAVAKLKQTQTYLTAQFNAGSSSSSSGSNSSLGSGNLGVG
jgi:flagellar hook-associated protein 2